MTTIAEQIAHGGFHQGTRRPLCPRCGAAVTYGQWCPVCRATVCAIPEPCYLCEPATLARLRGLRHFGEEIAWDE